MKKDIYKINFTNVNCDFSTEIKVSEKEFHKQFTILNKKRYELETSDFKADTVDFRYSHCETFEMFIFYFDRSVICMKHYYKNFGSI